MTRDELILYATPTGALARACDQYFGDVERFGATAAQAYPPHCSLTGFFHRTAARTADIIEEVQAILDGAGQVRARTVELTRVAQHENWFGLELRSPRLIDITAAIIDDHPLGADDDALRPKEWLHLSLAYDVADVTPYVNLAGDAFDAIEPDGWEVGLWQRRTDGSWQQLTSAVTK